MPWKARKSGSKWEIVKTDTGEVVGRSDSKMDALSSIRARYASEGMPVKRKPSAVSGTKG